MTKKLSLPTKSASGRSRPKVANAASISGLVLALRQPHGPSRDFHVSHGCFGVRGIGRIDEHGHTSRFGHQLAQEFEPLCL
jgi:hypothetical protein